MRRRTVAVAGTAKAAGLFAATIGAVGARFALRAVESVTAGSGGESVGGSGGLLDAKRWHRSNHRGEHVTLFEGPAYVAGAAAGVLLTPGLGGRTRLAGLTAVLGAGALGAYDDLYGNADRRGLRGHLSALKSGEVTTGAVKLVGIGTLGVVCGALVRRGSAVDKALAGVVVAGAANAVNLLDLRPGRAMKAAALASAPGLLRRSLVAGDGRGVADGRGAAGKPVRGLGSGDGRGAVVLAAAGFGAAGALSPDDFGERAMLGDAGANALGALLGVAAAAGASRAGLAWRAAGLTAVTLASEKISFTRLIAAWSPLDALDRLGRRAAVPSRPPAMSSRGAAPTGDLEVPGAGSGVERAPASPATEPPSADPDPRG